MANDAYRITYPSNDILIPAGTLEFNVFHCYFSDILKELINLKPADSLWQRGVQDTKLTVTPSHFLYSQFGEKNMRLIPRYIAGMLGYDAATTMEFNTYSFNLKENENDEFCNYIEEKENDKYPNDINEPQDNENDQYHNEIDEPPEKGNDEFPYDASKEDENNITNYIDEPQDNEDDQYHNEADEPPEKGNDEFSYDTSKENENDIPNYIDEPEVNENVKFPNDEPKENENYRFPSDDHKEIENDEVSNDEPKENENDKVPNFVDDLDSISQDANVIKFTKPSGDLLTEKDTHTFDDSTTSKNESERNDPVNTTESISDADVLSKDPEFPNYTDDLDSMSQDANINESPGSPSPSSRSSNRLPGQKRPIEIDDVDSNPPKRQKVKNPLHVVIFICYLLYINDTQASLSILDMK